MIIWMNKKMITASAFWVIHCRLRLARLRPLSLSARGVLISSGSCTKVVKRFRFDEFKLLGIHGDWLDFEVVVCK